MQKKKCCQEFKNWDLNRRWAVGGNGWNKLYSIILSHFEILDLRIVHIFHQCYLVNTVNSNINQYYYCYYYQRLQNSWTAPLLKWTHLKRQSLWSRLAPMSQRRGGVSPAADSAPWSRTCGSRASWPTACRARWPSPTSEQKNNKNHNVKHTVAPVRRRHPVRQAQPAQNSRLIGSPCPCPGSGWSPWRAAPSAPAASTRARRPEGSGEARRVCPTTRGSGRAALEQPKNKHKTGNVIFFFFCGRPPAARRAAAAWRTPPCSSRSPGAGRAACTGTWRAERRRHTQEGQPRNSFLSLTATTRGQRSTSHSHGVTFPRWRPCCVWSVSAARLFKTHM